MAHPTPASLATTAHPSQAWRPVAGAGGPAASARRLRPGVAVVPATSVVAGLLLWQLLAAYVVKNGLFLAAPTQVIGAIVRLWATGALQRHLLTSGQEFLIGFALASGGGVPLGLAMASSESFKRILFPWVSAFYATPIVALSPLLILWLGIDLWSKVAVVISVVIFPVIINTETGVRSTDPQLIEAVRSFGASSGQIFQKVSLPSALPFILAGLRLGVGRGLIGVVVGELFGARSGLGFLIMDSAQVFNMPSLFAGVVVLAAIGIILTTGFEMLERHLVPWRQA